MKLARDYYALVAVLIVPSTWKWVLTYGTKTRRVVKAQSGHFSSKRAAMLGAHRVAQAFKRGEVMGVVDEKE